MTVCNHSSSEVKVVIEKLVQMDSPIVLVYRVESKEIDILENVCKV